MALTYWSGEDIIQTKEKPVYCKEKTRVGKSCPYRAVHQDSQRCGFHHSFVNDSVVIQNKHHKNLRGYSLVRNDKESRDLVFYGPHPKDYNSHQAEWLLPIK